MTTPSAATTFTNVETVSIAGAFTTGFDNYRIEIDVTASERTQLVCNLRTADADDPAAAYDTTPAFGNGAVELGADRWLITPNATDTHKLVLELSGPALPRFTAGWADYLSTGTNVRTQPTVGRVGIEHRAGDIFDGLTLASTVGTISGTIRVYGHNN